MKIEAYIKKNFPDFIDEQERLNFKAKKTIQEIKMIILRQVQRSETTKEEAMACIKKFDKVLKKL